MVTERSKILDLVASVNQLFPIAGAKLQEIQQKTVIIQLNPVFDCPAKLPSDSYFPYSLKHDHQRSVGSNNQ